MGKVYKFGDNFSTDYMLPGWALQYSRPEDLAKYCLAGYDPDLVNHVEPGDVLVGGKNLGCGSSREHAPVSIKAAGFSCVIGASLARIFYRNCINVGLPAVEAPEAAEKIQNGDQVEIDLENGLIVNRTRGESYPFVPFNRYMLRIINAGGVVNYYSKK